MPSSRRRLLACLGAGAVAAVPAGWLVTDHLERDDDFCNACHLEPGSPLHRRHREGFDARPARSLAGAHGVARVDGREPRDMRCIDCHGGVGLVGRARVKMLAAKDAFWYVSGRFDEPGEMRWPLRDEDCARCHAAFDTREPGEWETPRFHQLPVHNVDLGVACVSCHVVHDEGGDPEADFLHVDLVRRECARCHSEFEEEPR